MKRAIALPLLWLPQLALAHSGPMESAVAAFAHPWLGWDHLLAMLLVGVLAARDPARRAWRLPALFVAGVLVGTLAGANGFGSAGWLEPALVGSVIALATVVALAMPIAPLAAGLMCAVFGVVHGAAHGLELDGNLLPLLGGLVTATALLHAIGYGLARLTIRRMPWAMRTFAALAGLSALVAAARVI